jgi:hypothetical protein
MASNVIVVSGNGRAKSPSKLKAVAPKAAEPSKPKVLVYGKPGAGKTWWALEFPSVYYIDTEGGANLSHYTDKLEKAGGMYFGPDQGSLSFETVIEQIQALATEEHGFRTVVIDSITKLFAIVVASEAERLGEKDVFGASKKPAVAYMRRLVSWLQRVDLNVILIAHEKPMWGIDRSGQRTEIGVQADVWDKLDYELHLSLNVIKQGEKRIAKVTKSRLLGFPDGSTFPWIYSEFSSRYGRDVIEKPSVQLQLATPEQISEVKRLLEVVRLADGAVERWFTAANVTDWAEMDGNKILKCIAALKSKVLASQIPA